MYVPARNCIVILTPKCGTTTMRAALEGQYGKLPLPGHLSERQQIEALAKRGIVPDYSVVVWRDPVERFFSAFLHVYSGWRDLDEALTHALHTGKASQKVFHSQKSFLDAKIERRVFDFPPADALRSLGVEGGIPKLNENRRRWALADVAHRMDEIEAFVADDVEFANGLQEEKGPQKVRLTKSGKPDRRFKGAA